MDGQLLWSISIFAASGICAVAWFAAIGLVALKLGSANGSYRLLTLVLALCMIFAMQSYGFVFNAIDIADNVESSAAFRIGTMFTRFCSLLGALAVLYFGQPSAPPKTRSITAPTSMPAGEGEKH